MSNILLRLESKNLFPFLIAAVKNQIIENSMDYFQILLYEYQCYNFIIHVKIFYNYNLKTVSLFTKNRVLQHNINFSFYVKEKTDSAIIKSIDNKCQKKIFAEQIFLFSQLWHPSLPLNILMDVLLQTLKNSFLIRHVLHTQKKYALFLKHLVY